MADALQNTLTGAGLALAPLRAVDSPQKAVELFRKLGYEIPPAAFGGSLASLGNEATQLVAAVDTLARAQGDAAVATALAQALARLGATIDAISQLHAQLLAGGAGAVPDIAEMPRRLTDFLALDYLQGQRPETHAIFHLLGLLEHEPAAPAGQPQRLINWDRLGKVITDPASIADDVYAWNTDFDTDKFLARLEQVMRAAGLRGGLYGQSDVTRTALGNAGANQELRLPILQRGLTPETYSQFGIAFSPAEPQGPKKRGLALLPYLMGTSAFDFGVCERGELIFDASGEITGVGVVVRPPFDAEGLLNLVAAFQASITIREKATRSEEMVIVGSPGGTRLAIEGLGVKWFVSGDRAQVDLGVEGNARAIRLVIAGGEGDGFLQKVLAGLNVRAEAGLGLGMSLQSGFTFHGGARLAVDLATHLDIGPLKIDALRFALAPTSDQIALEAGAVLKLELGPLHAVVENIGVTTAIAFAPGNLGPADLSVDFKPPNGVGLSLDAGGFKGGGYLAFDADRGEYAGALELDFQGLFSVKAVGVINTRMPDGSAGFSLLIVISAEFTPIQLSFGFTLNGVGGIIGLNRTIAVPALVEGVRTNAIKSVLFPRDVVANISRIVSDIKQFFPPQEGHFVVGPMAKLGWGTPSIVTVEAGLLLDLPNPMFAIFGVLRANLPAEEAPILQPPGELRGRARLRARLPVLPGRRVRLAPAGLHDHGQPGLPGLLGRAEDVRPKRRRLPPRLPRHPEHPRAARRLPPHGADRPQPVVGGQPAPEGRVVLRGHVEHRAVRRQGRALRSGRRLQRLRLPRLRRPLPVRAVPLHRPAVRRHRAPVGDVGHRRQSTSPRSCKGRHRGMPTAGRR